MFFQHPNMFMLYGDILCYCLKRKTAAFEYEAEYRLGFHFGDHLFEKSDSEKNIDVEKVFVQSDNVIKPQIELKDFPVKELIEENIVSPYNTSDLTVLGIQELLAKHSISKNIVKKSTVTIR